MARWSQNPRATPFPSHHPPEVMERITGPDFGWPVALFEQMMTEEAPLPPAEVVAAQTSALRLAQRQRRDYPLIDFVRQAWPYIEPQPYIHGWHLDASCRHLEAVTETAAATDECPAPAGMPIIRNLLINVPPRTSKSLVTSVLWHPWVWLTFPSCRFLSSSYSAELALRDATYSRTLMSTDWYQGLLAQLAQSVWHFTSDQNVKGFYSNSAQGYRISTSVGGKATGFGALIRIGDDLHSVAEDYSTTRAEIQAAKQFWTMTMASRYTDAKRSCQVLVGQRVALDDVSAAVLQRGDYAYLRIPMEYEPEHTAPGTPLGWVDPRTTPGELLCPERFGPEEVATLKLSLGHRYYTQYQQRPVTELSSLFPRSRWQWFHVMPPADWFDAIIQSWDYRFGDKKQSGSFVAGHVWGRKGPPESGQLYLLDRVFERLSFSESVKETERLSAKWPGAYAKLVEQAANGQAIYETLRSRVFGLVLVPVGGRYSSKEARAEAVAYLQEAGRVWLPHPTIAPWVDSYADHMERFPADPQDDTDATSQAWQYLCHAAPAKDTVRESLMRTQALQQQMRQAVQRQRRIGTGV